MMGPTLLPRIQLREISQASELAVAKALTTPLDDGWIVFHSYSWLRQNAGPRKKHLKEGEADFVLLHRKWGLLILEVKGGEIGYDAETGLWRQNHHSMKDPFKQAQTNMHALIEQIGERCRFIRTSGKGLPCPYGYAVAFPACNFSGTLPAGAHPAILFGARDLPSLSARVEAALKHWAVGPASQPMEPCDYKALKEALTSTFRPTVSIASQVNADEEVLIKLTEDQTEQLMGLLETPRAAVEGVAGSGKTLLALLRAQAFAQEGKGVLFLCYNKKLAESIERRSRDVSNLRVANFHRLCHDLCREASVSFEIPSDPEEASRFWSETAPEQMAEAVDRLPDVRFDALIVDEAQDFQDLWWVAIDKLCREPNGPMYLFYDRDQNIYGSSLDLPITAPHYKLRTNCRNTRSIAAGCSSILGSSIRSSSFAPTGEVPKIVITDSPEEIRAHCESVLSHALARDGMSASRAAVLSTKSRRKSCLEEGELGGYPLTDELEEWESGKAVWFSTVKAFKGLEADLLILIEAGDFHPVYFSRQDLYVAASRAKHRLHVLTSSKEVADALKPVASAMT
jgi:hypothetical protein